MLKKRERNTGIKSACIIRPVTWIWEAFKKNGFYKLYVLWDIVKSEVLQKVIYGEFIWVIVLSCEYRTLPK